MKPSLLGKTTELLMVATAAARQGKKVVICAPTKKRLDELRGVGRELCDPFDSLPIEITTDWPMGRLSIK